MEKITIQKNVSITETISIQFPYFYKRDYGYDFQDTIVYGKIEWDKETSVEISEKGDEIKYIIEQEEFTDTKRIYSGSDFEPKYKSSKEEYERAIQKAKDFIANI